MRKNITLSLVLLIALFLVACGDNSSNSSNSSSNTMPPLQSNSPDQTQSTSTEPQNEIDNPSQSGLRSMTIANVKTISESIGSDLSMEDLSEYAVDDIEEGLYGFRVVGGVEPYNLLVASDDGDTVIYTKLYNVLLGGLLGNTSEEIDIRYFNVDKFIADGTKELIRALPESDEVGDINIVGTWSSDMGGVTHFYEDGTGRTVDDTGEHDFAWEIISLKEAVERKSAIREYMRVVYGEDAANPYGEDAWGEDDYLISLTVDDLTFDDAPLPLDFPYTMENQDTMTINTMQFGQILSPTMNLPLRFVWITLTRTN